MGLCECNVNSESAFLFKASGEVGKDTSVGFCFARSQFVDSEVLALKRMLFVVFLLRPFPLGGRGWVRF